MKLNRRQRVVLFVGLVVAVVMGLFPPWEHKRGNRPPVAQKYCFIGRLHARVAAGGDVLDKARALLTASGRGRPLAGLAGWRIDTTTLWVQWFTVAFATAAAVTLLGDWSKHNTARNAR